MTRTHSLTAAEVDDRVAHTVDAILSIPYVHTSAVATVHVLIDHLLLLGDHPASVNVGYERSGPIHSSLPARERNLAFEGHTRLAAESDTWTDHRIKLVLQRARIVADGTPSLATVFTALRQRDSRGYQLIFERLGKFLEKVRREARQDWTPLGYDQELTQVEVEKLLYPFQRRYEAIQSHLGDSGSLFLALPRERTRRSGAVLPPAFVNLFALVRYVPRSPFERTADGREQPYEYDTRLILTDTQREVLTASGSDSDGDSDPVPLSEVPLCPRGSTGSGWADIALASGHVFTAECPPAADPSGWPFAALVPDASRVVSLPVHVGGTAWCCLFTYYPLGAWSHVHRLYRDTVPQLAHDIRTAAREAFLESLEQQLRRVLSSGRAWDAGVVAEINQAWLRTCLVYPFSVPKLTSVDELRRPPDGTLRIGSQHVLLDLCPSAERPLQQDIDYDQLSKEDVLSRCSAAIQRLQQFRLAQLDTVFAASHEIKNALAATKWYSVLDQLVRLEEDEPIGPDLRWSIRFSLERMIWPVSLAAILRAIAKSHGTNLRSLWLERGAEGFDIAATVGVYTESVRFLVGYIAHIEDRHARDLRLLECSAESISAARVEDLWASAQPVREERFDISKLRFPPFLSAGTGEKEGEENAPFVPASLLAEPLRNAVFATKKEAYAGLSCPLLCWSVSAAGGEVVVELCNAIGTTAKSGPPNVNVALMSRLGSLLNVGTIEPPRVIETTDGARFVGVRVHLHPHLLESNPLVLSEEG